MPTYQFQVREQDGSVTRISHPGGVTTHMPRDSVGRVSELRISAPGGMPIKFDYQYERPSSGAIANRWNVGVGYMF